MNRSRLLQEISAVGEPDDIASGLRSIADYVGASTYLLARWDAYSQDSLDFAISADWPFDLVRSLGSTLVRGQLRKTEINRCLEAMQPVFVECPPTVKIPPELTRRLCLIPFDIGTARLVLILGFGRDMVLSDIRLEDVGFACAYYLQHFEDLILTAQRQHDLTQREVDCLNWIAEGKTSDEISLIIGISCNTVNNYITSIMNKTTTKTRSEAIAFAIRNNVI